MPWATTLLTVAGISVLSLSGALVLALRKETLQRALIVLISFAAGALLGDAFLHLLPEIAETETGLDLAASSAILAGVVAFFVLENILHWHHAHLPGEDVLHPLAVTNLVGDALHNFLDGAIVAGAFVADPSLGIATAVAVALHEIPQELGDFGILVHSGLAPRRALALNFLTAVGALVGASAVLATASVAGIERILVPFSAGAFIYIAGTDLIPELHKEPEIRRSMLQLTGLLAGIGVMAALLLIE